MSDTKTSYPYMKGVVLDQETTAAVNQYIISHGWHITRDFSKALRQIVHEWIAAHS